MALQRARRQEEETIANSVVPAAAGGTCRRFKAMPVRDEAREQARVVDHLRRQFPHLEPETVRTAVASSWTQYTDAPVRDFVPVLASRAAQVALASRNDVTTVVCA